MEYQEYRSLTRKQKTMLFLASLARLFVGLFIIVMFMWLTPDSLSVGVLLPSLMVVAFVVLYILYFKRQLRLVRKSRMPMLRAIEALIFVIALFLAMFAVTYVIIDNAQPGAFTEEMDDFTAFYYAMTVLATVGFGDITPVNTLARSLSMVQMAIDITIVGVAFKVLSGSAQQALKQRKGSNQESASDSK